MPRGRWRRSASLFQIGEARNTTGPRVGQVRLENGLWVCRYEFYSYLGNPTHTNQAGEIVEVLE